MPPAPPFSASPASRSSALRDSPFNKMLAQDDQGLAGLEGRRKPDRDPQLPPWGSKTQKKQDVTRFGGKFGNSVKSEPSVLSTRAKMGPGSSPMKSGVCVSASRPPRLRQVMLLIQITATASLAVSTAGRSNLGAQLGQLSPPALIAPPLAPGAIALLPWELLTAEGMRIPAHGITGLRGSCLLYTSPSPRDATLSRMPSSA